MNDIYNRKDKEFSVIGEVPESFKFNDPLYKEGFQAGAASRDDEVATLRELKQLYQTERDQLREQVAILREALLTCSVGDFSTGHVMYPSFDEKLVEEALAATEPKL